MTDDNFAILNLQNKLQMFNNYCHSNNNIDRLQSQMGYGEPEHFELIRNSQTMTDKDKKTLIEFCSYAKPKLSEIIGVKNVPITPCERYTNGITVNVSLKIKHFDNSFDEYKKYFQEQNHCSYKVVHSSR